MKVYLIDKDSKRNYGEFRTIEEAKDHLSIKFANGDDTSCKSLKDYFDNFKFVSEAEYKEQIRRKGGSTNSIYYHH